jgi:arsenate reductase (thioredoxin)
MKVAFLNLVGVGRADVRPVLPGRRYLDWDPAGRPVAEVRPIRDEIDARIRALLAELAAGRG